MSGQVEKKFRVCYFAGSKKIVSIGVYSEQKALEIIQEMRARYINAFYETVM